MQKWGNAASSTATRNATLKKSVFRKEAPSSTSLPLVSVQSRYKKRRFLARSEKESLRRKNVGAPLQQATVVRIVGLMKSYAEVVRVVKGRLVGAGGLDVAGLLALVAHTLVGGLGWAVTAQVANLSACGNQSA